MPKKKPVKGSPEPEAEEQKQPPLSAADRRTEIAKGIALICLAVGFFVYGTVTMLYFGEIRVLIPGGRGSLGLFVSGPVAWLHYLFYIFFCAWIIAVSTDYIYGEDTKGLRDKVAEIVFYALSFMLFHLFGPDGDGIPRYKLFGYYYHLRGPALWSFYLFYLCVTVFIIALLPWKTKYDWKDRVLSITWKFLVVFLVTTSALALSMDRIDAWISKDRKTLQDRGFKYDEFSFENCIAKNDAGCVKLFLSAGMDIDTVLEGGAHTPLALAASKGYQDLVQLLLERKADVNARSKTGDTALFYAVRETGFDEEQYDLIKFLLDHGADPNVKNRSGETLLGAAKHRNKRGKSQNIVDLLEQHHAKE